MVSNILLPHMLKEFLTVFFPQKKKGYVTVFCILICQSFGSRTRNHRALNVVFYQ